MTDDEKVLFDRMAALVRQMAARNTMDIEHYDEAKAIVVLFPKPLDPDEALALEIAAEVYGIDAKCIDDNATAYQAALIAIKRIRSEAAK